MSDATDCKSSSTEPGESARLHERVRAFIAGTGGLREARDSDWGQGSDLTTAEFRAGWNRCADRMLRDFADFDPGSAPVPAEPARCGVVLAERFAPCSLPPGHTGGHFWAPTAPQAPEVRTVPSEPPPTEEPRISTERLDQLLFERHPSDCRCPDGDQHEIDLIVAEVSRARASGGVRERVEALRAVLAKIESHALWAAWPQEAKDEVRAALGETTDGSTNGGDHGRAS